MRAENLFETVTKAFENGSFKGIDLVLFDCFDTIVGRAMRGRIIDGQELKRYAATRLRNALGLSFTVDQIFELRCKLELQLSNESTTRGYDDEFRFIDLCIALWQQTRANPAILDFRIGLYEFIELAIQCELSAEKDTQFIDKSIFDAVELLKKNGKKVGVASNFYLEPRLFKRMLATHGIDNIFDEIFVSSEALVSKRSGRLFDYISESTNINPSRMLIIGDNAWSDGTSALAKGLKSILVKPFCIQKAMQCFLKYECVTKNLEVIASSKNEVIFPEISSSLFVFIYSLFRRLTYKGITKVSFLAREGEFLQKLFVNYQEIFFGKQIIESNYLKVSRRSTFIAGCKDLSEETFDGIFRQYNTLSIVQFLRSLGASELVISKLTSSDDKLYNTVHENFSSSIVFNDFKKTGSFIEWYDTYRVQQKQLLKKLIKSQSIQNYRLTIIDVGWKGTIQDNLQRVMSDERFYINGFYFGLIGGNRDHFYDGIDREGLIFDNLKPHGYDSIYTENITLFETLLSASHGSSVRYKLSTDKTSVDTELEYVKEEEIHYRQNIKPQQEQYEKIFGDICKVFKETFFCPDEFLDRFAKLHARMVFLPTREEKRFFSEVQHFENFGLFSFTKFSSQENIDIFRTVQSFIQLIKKPAQIRWQSTWPMVSFDITGLGCLGLLYGNGRMAQYFPDSSVCRNSFIGKFVNKFFCK